MISEDNDDTQRYWVATTHLNLVKLINKLPDDWKMNWEEAKECTKISYSTNNYHDLMDTIAQRRTAGALFVTNDVVINPDRVFNQQDFAIGASAFSGSVSVPWRTSSYIHYKLVMGDGYYIGHIGCSARKPWLIQNIEKAVVANNFIDSTELTSDRNRVPKTIQWFHVNMVDRGTNKPDSLPMAINKLSRMVLNSRYIIT